MASSAARSRDHQNRSDDRLADAVRARALPLVDADSLDPLLDTIGDARFVLLGEASHGTSEFYTWRAAISRRLIEEKGFSFIAVEGDWPDCYRVNRYVKGHADSGADAESVLHAFDRWPTWMWANREMVELVEWLGRRNAPLPWDRRVGFYGLDVYSLYDSLRAVTAYLEHVDPEAARAARKAYSCFEPYAEDVQEYARATALVPTSCEDETIRILTALRARAPSYREDGRDAYFDAEQNALVARNAELYYRTMVRGGSASWNVRDYHMMETLDRLAAHHGPGSKAIVWEHNTHIGDARFTDMARAGMVNVGQLARQAHERDGVVLVGFGTHRGSVIAGAEWGAPMERMAVPSAREGSYEALFHAARDEDFLLLFDDERTPAGLEEVRGHRAIGVVYDPRLEHWGNYVPTILPSRYDAFLFIDESHALDPLHMPIHVDGDAPETYPTGQ
jgi:erythromycin esterase-like protein